MCGIFAISGDQSNNAGQTVLEGLKKLEYRGYDSWGVAINTAKGIKVQKNVGKISDASVSFDPATKAIGHSRWATHGGVTAENSHPHSYKTVTLVHNGIFENYLEEKKRLKEKGHTFTSQTDTEVIAHLIYESITQGNSPKDAVQKISQKITGRFALLVIIEGEEGIIAARRGSPLIIGRDTDQTYIASDIPAFLAFTKTVNYLDDDEMAIINHGNVEYFSILTGESILKRNIEVEWEVELAEKGEYDHFCWLIRMYRPCCAGVGYGCDYWQCLICIQWTIGAL